MPDYDIITVGGGIAASALAKAMAERGKNVLVLERETDFRDRVRGEWIAPWGVAEAQEMGLYDTLLAAGGHTPPVFQTRAGPMPLPERRLPEDCPTGTPQLTIYHPAMQEAMIKAAADAGAEVRRGVKVTAVRPRETPEVELSGGEVISARLVVGADGRTSNVRKWAGFKEQEAVPEQSLAGVLMDDVPVSQDASVAVFNPFMGRVAFLFPQGGGRVRAYLGVRKDSGVRLSGDGDFGRFIDLCVETGAPREFYEGVSQAGPLATFDGYDSWVEHPYKDGVALVGDAASTSDQVWGQGCSISLRGARLLRDALLETDDWKAAGERYAEAASEFARHVRTANGWATQVMMEQGEAATALRAQVLPRMAADPTIFPDTGFAGPDLAPADEAARARFFGN
jgi:2-polyprenyl-6-methoxyphenol hydroxylase-like FAD-dependent oxidoreductase